MNRADVITIGGNDFVLDDLEFQFKAYEEAFRGLLSFFGDVTLADNSFIISGCDAVFNAPNFDISAGFISFKGEVMFVPAHSILDDAGKVFFWDEAITFDPNGDEVFDDASNVQTYEIRQVQLKSDVAPPADIMLFDRLNPADPSLTQTKLVIRKQFSEGINTTGTPFLTKVVPVGSWDMDADAQIPVSVVHGLADHLKIRHISVIIIDDGQAIVRPLDYFENGISGMAGGIISIGAGAVGLRRATGSLFNAATHNNAGINRGFMTITFEA